MKAIFPVILIGLLIRLLLMPLYIHPDVRGTALGTFLIAQKGRALDLYDYLSTLPASHQLVTQYHTDLFIYPPLAYWAPAIFMKILSPIYPWELFNQLIFDVQQAQNHAHIPLLYYLIKLPYLLPDFLGLLAIWYLSPANLKKLATTLWIFNPFTLYFTYLLGQFDIWIAALSIFALYLSIQKSLFGPILMGLAAGFKPFPLFFLPFLPGSPVKNTILGLATYLLLILPYLPSPNFRAHALFAPQTSKFEFAQIPVSQTQHLPIFIVAITIFAWHRIIRPQRLPVWAWPALVSLTFYSLTHFHPQWFMWITPFAILWFVHRPRSRLLWLGFFSLFIPILFTFDPSLHFNIFGSSFDPAARLSQLHLLDLYSSFIRGALAATAIVLIHEAHSHA